MIAVALQEATEQHHVNDLLTGELVALIKHEIEGMAMVIVQNFVVVLNLLGESQVLSFDELRHLLTHGGGLVGHLGEQVVGGAIGCGVGEAPARDAGKLRQEGKEYVVQDGDVMHFKFNV